MIMRLHLSTILSLCLVSACASTGANLVSYEYRDGWIALDTSQVRTRGFVVTAPVEAVNSYHGRVRREFDFDCQNASWRSRPRVRSTNSAQAASPWAPVQLNLIFRYFNDWKSVDASEGDVLFLDACRAAGFEDQIPVRTEDQKEPDHAAVARQTRGNG